MFDYIYVFDLNKVLFNKMLLLYLNLFLFMDIIFGEEWNFLFGGVKMFVLYYLDEFDSDFIVSVGFWYCLS